MDAKERKTPQSSSKSKLYRSKSAPASGTRKRNEILGINGKGLTTDDGTLTRPRLPTLPLQFKRSYLAIWVKYVFSSNLTN